MLLAIFTIALTQTVLSNEKIEAPIKKFFDDEVRFMEDVQALRTKRMLRKNIPNKCPIECEKYINMNQICKNKQCQQNCPRCESNFIHDVHITKSPTPTPKCTNCNDDLNHKTRVWIKNKIRKSETELLDFIDNYNSQNLLYLFQTMTVKRCISFCVIYLLVQIIIYCLPN